MGALRLAGFVAIGAMVALAGCLLFSRSEQEPRGPLSIPFNHLVHADKATLECANCHTKAATDEQAGMPKQRQCLLCHGQGVVPGQKQPFELELAALQDPMAWPTRNKLPDYVRFSHSHHLGQSGITCESCHGDTGRSTAVKTSVAKVKQADCARCHTERGLAASDCQRCHVEGWGTTLAPKSHQQDWIRRHGPQARAGFFPDHGQDCASCHREDKCASCHKVQQPTSHTVAWRERAHGFAASVDRESCTVCHTQDSCQRCHETLRPSSHRPGWGSPQDKHCNTCHLGDLEAAGCAVCHRGTPSHAAATARPSWHAPGMNCRQCHGLSIKLPHPDNGDDCTSCHP